MSSIGNIEWLSKNCLRNYPVTEGVELRDPARAVPVPSNVLVDTFLCVPSAPQGLYVSAMCFTKRIVTVTFADCATRRALCAAQAILGQTASYETVDVQPIQDGVSGTVCFGNFMEQSSVGGNSPLFGTHYFSPQVKLENHAFLESGQFPVTSLSANDILPFYGVVNVSGSYDLIVSINEGGTEQEPETQILLSLKDKSKFASPCQLPSSICACRGVPIRSINGVTGDPDNGMNLTLELVGDRTGIRAIEPMIRMLVRRDGRELCQSRVVIPDETGNTPASAITVTTTDIRAGSPSGSYIDPNHVAGYSDSNPPQNVP